MTTDPASGVWTTQYDDLRNLASDWTFAEGDPFAASLKNPTANAAGWGEDFNPSISRTAYYAGGPNDGLPLSATDPMGHTTTFAYEAVATPIPPACGSTALPTLAPGPDLLILATQPDLSTRQALLDPAGRLLQSTDELGVTTQWTYNPAGQVKTVTEAVGCPEQRTTSYSYDARGDLETLTLPDGSRYTYEYFRYTVDPNNPQTPPVAYPSIYEGRVTHLQGPADANGGATDEYFGYYDLNGTTIKDAGELGWKRKRDGQLLTISRDALHRMTGFASLPGPGDGITNLYQYDEFGRVKTRTDNTGTYNYSYDALGRPTQVQTPPTQLPLVYSYLTDLANHRWTVQTTMGPLGSVGSFTSSTSTDAKGRIAAIVDPYGNTASFLYDPDGKLVWRRASPASGGAGTFEYRGYNNRDFLTQIDWMGPGGFGSASNPQGYAFGVDRTGREFAKVTWGSLASEPFAEQYGYDHLYRLTYDGIDDDPQDPLGIVGPSTFTYDANDNRTRRTYTATGRTTYYQYARNGEIEWTNEAGNVAPTPASPTNPPTSPYALYTYDADGRLLTREVGYRTATGGMAYQIHAFNWRADDRMTSSYTWDPSVANGFVSWASITDYDGEGSRMSEIDPMQGVTTTHNYAWGPGGLSLDSPQSFVSTTSTTPFTLYTAGIGEHDQTQPHPDRFYYENGRGDPRFYGHLDGSGTDEGVFTNAYGERVGDGNLGWNPGELLYGGGYGYESEPGDDTHGGLTLDYVGDRYYDPTIGRFISPDPIGLSGGLNLYAYAGDDPVNNVDPSGDGWRKTASTVVFGAIGAGVGGLSGGVWAPVGLAAGAGLGNAFGGWLEGETVPQAALGGVDTGALTFIVASGVGDVCASGVAAYRLYGLSQIAVGGGALTAEEEEAAQPYWNPTTVNGTRVYQRNDLIDTSKMDRYGRSNLDRMTQGFAPLGPDDLSINLHHILQSQDSPLAEMTQTFHQQNTSTIHINPSSIPTGIDRGAFGTWRQGYWRTRALDFIP